MEGGIISKYIDGTWIGLNFISCIINIQVLVIIVTYFMVSKNLTEISICDMNMYQFSCSVQNRKKGLKKINDTKNYFNP